MVLDLLEAPNRGQEILTLHLDLGFTGQLIPSIRILQVDSLIRTRSSSACPHRHRTHPEFE